MFRDQKHVMSFTTLVWPHLSDYSSSSIVHTISKGMPVPTVHVALNYILNHLPVPSPYFYRHYVKSVGVKKMCDHICHIVGLVRSHITYVNQGLDYYFKYNTRPNRSHCT